MLHSHARRTGRELRLGQRVDLRASKAVAVPRVGVGCDVKAIRVGADVRVITQVGTRIDPAGVRPVIGHIDLVDLPGACRICSLADGDIQVIHLCEPTSGPRVQGEHNDEEPLGRGVVQARRVGQELGSGAGRAVDRRRVSVERVQIDGVVHITREAGDDVRGGVVREHGLARLVVDVQYIVDRLHDIPVTDAQRLVGWLQGELVPSPSVALLVEVQPFEACGEDRIGLRLLPTVHGDAVAVPAREAAVDDDTRVRTGPFRLVELASELCQGHISGTRRGESAGGGRGRAGELHRHPGAGVRRGLEGDEPSPTKRRYCHDTDRAFHFVSLSLERVTVRGWKTTRGE